jgi:hypothetical protein
MCATHVKNRSTQETELLKRLSFYLSQQLCDLTYREFRSLGIGSKQYYELKRSEPINITIITLDRIARYLCMSVSQLFAEVEKLP